MIDQVPGYPRREEASTPVSSQAGVASYREGPQCACGSAGPAWRTKFGIACIYCQRDFFQEKDIHD